MCRSTQLKAGNVCVPGERNRRHGRELQFSADGAAGERKPREAPVAAVRLLSYVGDESARGGSALEEAASRRGLNELVHKVDQKPPNGKRGL